MVLRQASLRRSLEFTLIDFSHAELICIRPMSEVPFVFLFIAFGFMLDSTRAILSRSVGFIPYVFPAFSKQNPSTVSGRSAARRHEIHDMEYVFILVKVIICKNNA
jgi:hypothetical protein